MMRLPLAYWFAITVSLTTGGMAEATNEKVMIPLDVIWGYNMPGTLNVEELDERGLLFAEIRRSLWAFPSKDKDARPGFAVAGTGLESLREVHAILVKNQKPRQTFPKDSDICVVFFSYQNQPYVHLHSVRRQGSIVEVRYQFVPHETEETTEHFALIPLGKLPSGKYDVKFIRSPMPQKYIDLGFRPTSDEVARRVVCGSFSFSVAEQGE
jgi:hypothetical protein